MSSVDIWYTDFGKKNRRYLMMKNIKKLALVAMLVGSVAVVLASCGKNAGGDNKPSGFTMNAEQKKAYDLFIGTAKEMAKQAKIPKDIVKQRLAGANEQMKNLGFKIVDTKENEDVEHETDEAKLEKYLRDRFKPVAL